MPATLPAADVLSLPPEARAFARFDDYLGPWAMLEDRFVATFNVISATDIIAHMHERQTVLQVAGDCHLHHGAAPRALVDGVEQSSFGYYIRDGIAFFEFAGALMKHASSFGNNTSTVEARAALRDARRNPKIRGAMTVWDTPGGTVAGTLEFADELAAFAAAKPLHGYAPDLCASAGIWGATQCHFLSAGPNAVLGSIGTYHAVVDYSGKAEKEGVKVHVVKADGCDAFKGAGVPGTKVTDEQLGEVKRIINGYNAHFLAGVARGRKMPVSRVEVLADGRVHLAADAKKLGLIDDVESFDAALARLQAKLTSTPPGARSMSQTTNAETTATPAAPAKPAAATSAEIRAACPGASADFILAQLDAGATVAAAMTAFIAEQSKQLAAANQAAAEAKAAAPVAKRPGVPPVQDTGKPASAAAGGDAIAQVEEAVVARMETRREPRHVAFRNVMRADANRRAAYNAAMIDQGRRAG